MCRWLAYQGSSIYLDQLLFKPEHSLVDQSQHAQRTLYQTNGDGFGLGWYGERSHPGVYRHTRPAWNDRNLRSLAEQIRSRLFLAHVRATSGTAIQRTNCHPFQWKQWLFQHNGEINEFDKVRRDLDMEIASEFYPHMEGSTDTERLFYLALTYGLAQSPVEALSRMVLRVEELRAQRDVAQAFRMAIATTDGTRLYAARYSSNAQSPSLYHSRATAHSLRDICGEIEELPTKGTLILSEPLDAIGEHWEEVPESKLLIAEQGEIKEEVAFP